MQRDVSVAAEFRFECKLPNGLHARPSSRLAEVANRFQSRCGLTNLRSGATADLKGVLSTIAADVRRGDTCLLVIDGADGSAAAAALRRFIDEDLPGFDEPLAEAFPGGSAPQLPRGLESAGSHCLVGLPASGGIGRGKAVAIGRASLTVDFAGPAEDSRLENERIDRAFTGVRTRVERLLARNGGRAESAILRAHLAILGDMTLRRDLTERVARGCSAAQAVADTGEHFRALLECSGSGYIRERAIDVDELCSELLEEMYGARFQPAAADLNEPSIVVAKTLAPHQLLSLDRQWLEGIVLESAGATSHAVILARSMDVPAVVGVADATRQIATGAEAIVDGGRGWVFPRASEPVLRFYQRERAAQLRRQTALARFAAAPAISLDGESIDIGANVSSAAEAAAAFANGADGIGLFRTEILFAEREQPPSEEEQLAVYTEALRAAAGRPVILRTADVGGDKPLPYLRLPDERNPFLGFRGIRLYPEHREWISAQFRAALRASARGPIWLMAPMIASGEEASWFKNEVGLAKAELRASGLPFDEKMPIGAMIEVPSAAFALDRLCVALDFFSIGTNDLSQYFFAADRENPKLAAVANVRHPAFLALLHRIARRVREHGKWVGLCGEMAADARNLPLLLGLGLNEISTGAHAIPALKRAAARHSAALCRELLENAMASATAADVETLLDSALPGDPSEPLLSSALVTLRSDSRSKDEAIREVVGALYAAGRTEDPRRLEEVVWARESVYSTGLGHGFAVPHCVSDLVSVNSIGILKLDNPIEWGSLDGNPVRMVILLAMRETGQNGMHMKIFSRLARKLMDQEFRDRLMGIEDPELMISHVGRELEVTL